MNLSLERKALARALLAALLSLGSALLLGSPIQKITGSSPLPMTRPSPWSPAEIVTSPELAAQGADFFGQSCSHCHGDDAHGDEGPDLHNLAISNARIATTIKKGIKGEMPAFARKYDDQQVGALLSYLRTLR